MNIATAATEAEIVVDQNTPRWCGEPVRVAKGSPANLIKLIPRFERRPFTLGNVDIPCGEGASGMSSNGLNSLYDLIVRLPLNQTERETPVGVVSKPYRLVQHSELFEKACDAMKAVSIPLEKVSAELKLTVYGSRMAVTFNLPEGFDCDPGDGHMLKLQFHCFNSVDARSRLTIILGWFRFVCENGLVVGTARLNQRFIHNEYLELPDLVHVLSEDLKAAEKEKASFAKRMGMLIEERSLNKWTDGPLREAWGPQAAARVYLICQTGCDGRFKNPFEQAPPYRKSMIRTHPVPGAPSKAGNVYHVAQALAWVARARKDIQDQLDGMMEIPNLMSVLLT